MPQPAMVRRGRSMYVATQDGALLAFDLLNRRLQWALPYEGPEKGQSTRFFYYGMVEETTELHTKTRILERNGLLYVKEAGSHELIAIDPSEPAVIWRRPVEKAAQMVGVDDQAVYVLDRELSAIDRQSHVLRWAIRLPIDVGGLSAVVGPESILVLTGRGVYELERASGDILRIFRGADLEASGGALRLIGGQLVAITKMSVTSYGDAATAQAASP